MLILLDIDGVMLHANPWKRPEILDDGFMAFNLQATKALNQIIQSTDCEIFLTTSHKDKFNIKEWKAIFSLRGIVLKNISIVKSPLGLNRKDEIIQWYANNSDKNFIIIDDDKSLNGLPDSLKHKLIQTNPSIGLTNDLANLAISKLKRNINLEHV
jgi:hypothetical protein